MLVVVKIIWYYYITTLLEKIIIEFVNIWFESRAYNITNCLQTAASLGEAWVYKQDQPNLHELCMLLCRTAGFDGHFSLFHYVFYRLEEFIVRRKYEGRIVNTLTLIRNGSRTKRLPPLNMMVESSQKADKYQYTYDKLFWISTTNILNNKIKKKLFLKSEDKCW